MKSKFVRAVKGSQAKQDRQLARILLQCGRYYQPGELFFHRLWREHFRHLGFRVTAIEKLDCHHLWDMRQCGTLTAQSYLLLTKPVPHKLLNAPDLMERQLKAEVQHMAHEWGPSVKRDEITVVRTGAYFRVSFLWPEGEPGLLLRKEKKPHAFPFLIRPWLRSIRN